MTHRQLQQMIIRKKGSMTWRSFGESLEVAFQDLWSAANCPSVPKSGILEALGVETVVEVSFRIKHPDSKRSPKSRKLAKDLRASRLALRNMGAK